MLGFLTEGRINTNTFKASKQGAQSFNAGMDCRVAVSLNEIQRYRCFRSCNFGPARPHRFQFCAAGCMSDTRAHRPHFSQDDPTCLERCKGAASGAASSTPQPRQGTEMESKNPHIVKTHMQRLCRESLFFIGNTLITLAAQSEAQTLYGALALCQASGSSKPSLSMARSAMSADSVKL